MVVVVKLRKLTEALALTSGAAISLPDLEGGLMVPDSGRYDGTIHQRGSDWSCMRKSYNQSG